MIISPDKIIENGIITGIRDDWKQPNAIDFSVDEIYAMVDDPEQPFVLQKDGKQHRARTKLEPIDGYWHLDRGAYDFMSKVYVEMRYNTAGWMLTRSTLNRNGIIVHSGLYDTGYKGHICGTIYNMAGPTKIEVGARIAQMVFVDAKNSGLYSGGYNTELGEKPEQMRI